MRTLAGKTLFITGTSRGIALAIAKRAARDGAHIAIAAKTTTPGAKLEATI
jgi:citronellol/citronellal dehydrogenase